MNENDRPIRRRVANLEDRAGVARTTWRNPLQWQVRREDIWAALGVLFDVARRDRATFVEMMAGSGLSPEVLEAVVDEIEMGVSNKAVSSEG